MRFMVQAHYNSGQWAAKLHRDVTLHFAQLRCGLSAEKNSLLQECSGFADIHHMYSLSTTKIDTIRT